MITLVNRKTYVYAIFGILSFIACSTSHAEVPSHYPSEFQWSGVVEEITDTSITINDRVFPISSEVTFNRLKTYNSTIKDIKIGVILGCRVSNTNTLISVWELPDFYIEKNGTSLSRGIR
jgi:hypothetical protein